MQCLKYVQTSACIRRYKYGKFANRISEALTEYAT